MRGKRLERLNAVSFREQADLFFRILTRLQTLEEGRALWPGNIDAFEEEKVWQKGARLGGRD